MLIYMECQMYRFNVGLVLLYYFEMVHYNKAVDAILKKGVKYCVRLHVLFQKVEGECVTLNDSFKCQ